MNETLSETIARDASALLKRCVYNRDFDIQEYLLKRFDILESNELVIMYTRVVNHLRRIKEEEAYKLINDRLVSYLDGEDHV